MSTTHTHRAYFVQYTLRNSEIWCVCLAFTNAYYKANVLDLYDTNSFKIGLLQVDGIWLPSCSYIESWWHSVAYCEYAHRSVPSGGSI